MQITNIRAPFINFMGFLALFALVACVPISENPIIVAGKTPSDDRLIGAWFGSLDEDDDPMYLHFLATDKNDEVPYPGGLSLMMLDHGDPENEGSWTLMYGLTAKINGESYLSVEFKANSDDEPITGPAEYYLFHYCVEGDTFEIRGIDEDLLEDHIETGALKGTIDKGRFTTDIRLTSTSQEWVTFLKSHSVDALFSEEKGTFKRK